ncbi:hypothetical protein HPB50_026631 [Hyalomma asiaticum]|uniref:Uncharacterized protein n=1 Tax=Hyalomma asiaticum TaxID=266040 RepID=A0ACB7RZH6_HYAAI|nr:hypothetical protein HPB50_026631 [Hyalomma asiaticum]
MQHSREGVSPGLSERLLQGPNQQGRGKKTPPFVVPANPASSSSRKGRVASIRRFENHFRPSPPDDLALIPKCREMAVLTAATLLDHPVGDDGVCSRDSAQNVLSPS